MKNLLGRHFMDFATSADLDGLARTVEVRTTWFERLFWTVAFGLAAVAALALTLMASHNYINGTPYDTGYNVDTVSGLVPFPDILLCTSAPWDLQKIRQHNISAGLVAYMSYFLFSFAGFGLEGASTAPPEILSLDQDYIALLKRKFDNNALYLLGNVTKTCGQILRECIFGMSVMDDDCCRFFGPPEFMFGFMCFRSGQKLLYSVQGRGCLHFLASHRNS